MTERPAHDLAATYAGKLKRARAAILWERLWPALWPLGATLGLFITLSLFDVWREIPGWLHLVALIGFAGAVTVGGWRAWTGLRVPSHEEARRRLEQASGLDHRPLLTIEDRQAVGDDPGARRLWEAHVARARASLRRLRIGWPRASWLHLDPFALRGALFVLLALGFVVANSDTGRRLGAAFQPTLAKAVEAPVRLDAWISPPAYTGLPPIFLTREDGPIPQAAPIRVPTGAKLMARINGGRGEAALGVDAERKDFQAIDPRNQQVEQVLTQGHRLTVTQGSRQIAAWPIDIVPDLPPAVTFASPPVPTQRLALQIDFQASDDYGLAKVYAEIRRDGSDEVLTVPLPLAGPGLKRAAEKTAHDLTEHLWAGLDVSIMLVAEDGIGQKGVSEPANIRLPERPFRHPVARALVELRRTLAIEPAKRGTVAKAIAAIMLMPEAFNSDTTVYLGLRTAGRRLTAWDWESQVGEVQKLMWDLALRLEDGNLSLAERQLRDAERALREALDRNAPNEEIDRLVEDLKRALDQFLQALAEQMERQAQEGQEPEELPPDAQMLSRDDLMRMLDQLRDMSQSGARDAARDMLSQLQRMMENLRAGKPQRSPGQANRDRQMREMGDLMRKQQELLDETFRRSQRQGEQGEGQQDGRGLAQRQEELRRMLEQMMRQLGQQGPGQRGQQGQQGEGEQQMGEGEQPGQGQQPGQGGPFGRAERSMRDARDALGRGQHGSAVGPQTDALDQLREGLRGMMEQMFGEGMDGRPPQGNREGRAGADREDPLGRPLPGEWDSGDSTKVPDKGELQRSREILEELLRRAGQAGRPLIEREYLERLLKRF